MRLEIPECRRCFVCVPLRYGIVVFGYLNLMFSVLVLALESWLGWGDSATSPTSSLYRGVHIFTHMWLPMLLYSLEIVFNLILIVGAHMKKTVFLRVYYYYGITTTIAALVILIVLRYQNDYNTFGSSFDVIDLTLGICGIVVQAYLLLLIRSELTKPRYQRGLVFVNHMSDAIAPPPWGEGRNPL